MQGIAKVRDFAGVGSPVVEIGGVHDQRVALPVADRIAHEQANVLAQVRAAVEADDPAGVVVIVEDYYRTRALQELIGIVSVLALKQSRQGAAGVQFHMSQIHRRIHVQQKIPALGILFRPPWQILVRWIHDARSALLTSGGPQNRAALSKDPRIWT